MAQWAIAFAAGAWVLLQVLGLAADSYEWPRIVMRVAFGVVVVGFLATLVLAWYHGERGQQKVGGTELLILALLLLVGGGLLWRMEHGAQVDTVAAVPASVAPPAAPAISDKSIAVLPFANLSSDKDNAYFAEGIQDEILTRLAKIGDLKVISRTSTLRFASKPDNLPEIARQLGVANIVEGSVQKVGNNVRINVQLIRADTDAHLWAEIYDRKLEDVFSIQSEVAGAIATALQATLTQDEKAQVALRPTESTAAYDAYLRGLSLELRDIYSFEMRLRARDQFAEAARLDPDFAEAWMRLVAAQSFLYFNNVERTPEVLEAMRGHVDTLARLRPDSGEAWLALGYFRYRGLYDYPRAVDAFREASKRLPNSAAALAAQAYVERRLGRFEPALEHLRQAEQLDPGNAGYGALAGEIFGALRRFPEAHAALDRALVSSPDDLSILGNKLWTYHAQGDLDAADALLAKMPRATGAETAALGAQIGHLLLRRRYDDVMTRARFLLATEEGRVPGAVQLQARLWLATALGLNGDAVAAKAENQRILQMIAQVRAAGVDESSIAQALAMAHAALGDKRAALREADRAIVVAQGDAKQTPNLVMTKALVLARFGDRDAALALLGPVLEVPYGTTPALLRSDPEWDVLRDDPRFRKLSGEAAPAR